MAEFPYVLVLQAVALANSTATAFYALPPNEKLSLHDVRRSATGAFSITDIRKSGGEHLTNASASTPILSTQIQDGSSPNIGFTDFGGELEIEGGETFYIDVKDTSGSGNTINLFFTGKRVTQ